MEDDGAPSGVISGVISSAFSGAFSGAFSEQCDQHRLPMGSWGDRGLVLGAQELTNQIQGTSDHHRCARVGCCPIPSR